MFLRSGNKVSFDCFEEEFFGSESFFEGLDEEFEEFGSSFGMGKRFASSEKDTIASNPETRKKTCPSVLYQHVKVIEGFAR